MLHNWRLAQFCTPPTKPVIGQLILSSPLTACEPLTNDKSYANRIVLVERGDCLFVTKVLNAQNAGAVAVVVYNNMTNSEIVLMTADEDAPQDFKYVQRLSKLEKRRGEDNKNCVMGTLHIIIMLFVALLPSMLLLLLSIVAVLGHKSNGHDAVLTPHG